MKKLSLNDIDYYIDLVKKMRKRFDLKEWRDADTDNYPIQFKLFYFVIAKILKELRISPALYEYKIPCFDMDIMYSDCARDEMDNLGEIAINLVNGIYAAYGWDVKNYWMDELYYEVLSELDIELSDIEDASYDDDGDIISKFLDCFTEDKLKEFLEDDYELLDEMVLGLVDCLASHILKVSDLYIYRNKKLGKYLSYLQEHPRYAKTPVGARIKKILWYDLNPNQFHIPPYKISGFVDSEGDYVMSNYFFYTYDSGEYISEAHIQMDRVVLVVLLDQLLDMAYKELNLTKEVA